MVNPKTILLFGNGLYQPSMVILGMVYNWLYHSIRDTFFERHGLPRKVRVKKKPSIWGVAKNPRNSSVLSIHLGILREGLSNVAPCHLRKVLFTLSPKRQQILLKSSSAFESQAFGCCRSQKFMIKSHCCCKHPVFFATVGWYVLATQHSYGS